MGHIEEIRKASGKELLFSLVFTSGAVCPGMLIVWKYAPEIVEKAGALTFLLLSLALTLPVISINTMTIIVIAEMEKKEVSKLGPLSLASACFVSMLAIGFPIFIAFMLSLPLKIFACWAIAGEVVAFFACIGLGIVVKAARSKN